MKLSLPERIRKAGMIEQRQHRIQRQPHVLHVVPRSPLFACRHLTHCMGVEPQHTLKAIYEGAILFQDFVRGNDFAFRLDAGQYRSQDQSVDPGAQFLWLRYGFVVGDHAVQGLWLVDVSNVAIAAIVECCRGGRGRPVGEGKTKAQKVLSGEAVLRASHIGKYPGIGSKKVTWIHFLILML